YAPRAKVVCVSDSGPVLLAAFKADQRVGWLRLQDGRRSSIPCDDAKLSKIIDMPSGAAAYAARLYAALHELDNASVDQIVIDLPPSGDAWLAVHDRLRRAAQT